MSTMPLLRLGAVPHGDDWWVSPQDVRDYASWLDARVQALDAAFKRPSNLAKPTVQAWGPAWIPWWVGWNNFRTRVMNNLDEVQGAWPDVKAKHEELLKLRADAVAAGVEGAPTIDPVPTEPIDKLGSQGSGFLGASVGGIGVGLAVGIVGVLALVFLRK